jgi:site-specific recombinase XerD
LPEAILLQGHEVQRQESQAPAVQVQVQEAPVQLPLEFRNLSSAELLRPQDQLKQSIEGFLLDQRSEHTRRAYGKDLKRFMMFLSARNFQQGPSELNRTTLIAYKESLLAEGLEHTSVDRHLATLKSFFNWLVEDGLLFRSPADGVRFLNPKRLSTTIGFTDEEVKKILAVPDLHTRVGSLHYAVLMTLFYCGLRRSEACSLRTTHLGTERNQRVLRLRGKGNAERIIVMIPPVWNALKHLFLITRRDLAVDQPLFMPIRNNRTQDLKKPIDPSMIFYIVTKYAKLAGIANRVSPHSCRATAISNARDHHVPDRAIQEFAGWASPDMITRYDKRRSAIEDSAAHSISYGAENRVLPFSNESPAGASSLDSTPDPQQTLAIDAQNTPRLATSNHQAETDSQT